MIIDKKPCISLKREYDVVSMLKSVKIIEEDFFLSFRLAITVTGGYRQSDDEA